ncbi:MAG: PAS domain S-box-containing protein [Chlamydiales bacterium]|jgi:PAS domain S-box-containing protein
MLSKPAPPSDQRPPGLRWYHLYYLLVIVDVVTIVGTLTLSHVISGLYQDSIVVNRQSAARLGDLASLRDLAMGANAPGNSVFDSHDVELEQSRLEQADAAFEAKFTSMADSIAGLPNASPERSESLQHIRDPYLSMLAESRELLRNMGDGREDLAGQHMNAMDEYFYGILGAISNSELRIRVAQSERFAAQAGRAEELTATERKIAAFVVLIVLAATYYGHRVSRAMVKADRQLRDSTSATERRNREISAILEATVDIIVVTDDAGNIQVASDSVSEIIGEPPAQLIGRRFESLVSSELESAAFLRQSGSCIGTTMLTRSDGGQVPVEISRACVEGDDGRSLCISVIRDVSERTRMEGELHHAQKLEAVGRLAAGIAHEINTPIQYVCDNVRFLQETFAEVAPLIEIVRDLPDSGQLDGNQASDLKRLFAEADIQFLSAEVPRALAESLEGGSRVREIVRAMKEFSHPGGMEMADVDLNHAIENTIAVARNEWKYVANLTTDLDPTLPHVPCFLGEFNQVVLNLIVNAADAIRDVVGEAPEHRGDLSIRTRREGANVEVRITDTGGGIPAHVRDRVFDPFFTTKDVGKGTGQGLSIAHTVIVNRHGGTIVFETEDGKGTSFVIRLPLVQQTQADVVAA